jgi:hypothetical protein
MAEYIDDVHGVSVSGPGRVCGRVIDHRTRQERLIITFDYAGLSPAEPVGTPVILYAVELAITEKREEHD